MKESPLMKTDLIIPTPADKVMAKVSDLQEKNKRFKADEKKKAEDRKLQEKERKAAVAKQIKIDDVKKAFAGCFYECAERFLGLNGMQLKDNFDKNSDWPIITEAIFEKLKLKARIIDYLLGGIGWSLIIIPISAAFIFAQLKCLLLFIPILFGGILINQGLELLFGTKTLTYYKSYKLLKHYGIAITDCHDLF